MATLLIGQRIHYLLLVGRRRRDGRLDWIVKCDCGTVKVVRASNLRNGTCLSCGCWKKKINPIKALIHGHAKTNKKTSIYKCWQSMQIRCRYPSTVGWKDYGGRGIKICKRWMKFKNFLADMGEKPEGMTLGRINNNGNYSPANCEWQTPAQQARNKRSTRFITFKGETLSMADWQDRLGGSKTILAKRLESGWSIKDALTIPVSKRGKYDRSART